MKNKWLQAANILFKINCFLLVVALALFFLAWSAKAEAKDIKVMVIDTGIGPHKYLNSYVQYDGSSDYVDDVHHGTHVAGIIVFGNQNRYPRFSILDPICHKVKIYSCKYTRAKGDLAFFSTDKDEVKREIECIKRATREGMDIINISAGGVEFSQAEYDAIKEFDGMVVAAAGNGGKSLETNPFYPASYRIGVKVKKRVVVQKLLRGRFINVPVDIMVDKFKPLQNVIPVSSTYQNKVPFRQSNRSPAAVQENGVDIYSTFPDDGYGIYTGTSQAAPAFLHKFLQYACKRMEK